MYHFKKKTLKNPEILERKKVGLFEKSHWEVRSEERRVGKECVP